MFKRKTVVTLLCLFVTFADGCQKSPPPAGDASSTGKPPTVVAAETPRQLPQLVSAADLQAVIMRTYKDAVIPHPSRQDSFVVGDFNGDKSQDIAIVVEPGKGKLSELNSEYANWILEDAVSVGVRVEQMSGHRLPDKSAPVLVRERDLLLAVIHGYQGAGWRDPKATQTYLLKNAVGDEMKTEPTRPSGSTAPQNPRPSLRGDVIREMRADTPGFVYWTGANYAWHSESPKR